MWRHVVNRKYYTWVKRDARVVLVTKRAGERLGVHLFDYEPKLRVEGTDVGSPCAKLLSRGDEIFLVNGKHIVSGQHASYLFQEAHTLYLLVSGRLSHNETSDEEEGLPTEGQGRTANELEGLPTEDSTATAAVEGRATTGAAAGPAGMSFVEGVIGPEGTEQRWAPSEQTGGGGRVLAGLLFGRQTGRVAPEPSEPYQVPAGGGSMDAEQSKATEEQWRAPRAPVSAASNRSHIGAAHARPEADVAATSEHEPSPIEATVEAALTPEQIENSEMGDVEDGADKIDAEAVLEGGALEEMVPVEPFVLTEAEAEVVHEEEQAAAEVAVVEEVLAPQAAAEVVEEAEEAEEVEEAEEAEEAVARKAEGDAEVEVLMGGLEGEVDDAAPPSPTQQLLTSVAEFEEALAHEKAAMQAAMEAAAAQGTAEAEAGEEAGAEAEAEAQVGAQVQTEVDAETKSDAAADVDVDANGEVDDEVETLDLVDQGMEVAVEAPISSLKIDAALSSSADVVMPFTSPPLSSVDDVLVPLESPPPSPPAATSQTLVISNAAEATTLPMHKLPTQIRRRYAEVAKAKTLRPHFHSLPEVACTHPQSIRRAYIYHLIYMRSPPLSPPGLYHIATRPPSGL